MVQELSRAQYLRAVNRPKRRFQTFAVTKSGLTLRDPVPSLCYWFERNDLGEEHGTGKYLRNPYLATISLVVDGKTAALFYLAGRRVDTCTFAYDLYPRQLSRAVMAMRRARLGRFILPAAEWAIREMPDQRRPALEKALRALVRSLRVRGRASARRRRTSA